MATRSEEALVSHDSTHFNVIVCLSQKYRPKIPSEDKLRGSQLLYSFLIAVRLLQQRQPRASSCLLPSSCGHGELVPRRRSLPTGLLLSSRFVEERPGAQTQAPVCLCEQRSWEPVPKHGWCLGLRKSAQLCACLCAEQAGSHLAGASLCLPGKPGSQLPAHPSITSRGGSQLLGAMTSCLLCKLSSGFWFSSCQPGTAALLT